jgi:anti-anti-sigma factor
MLAAPNQLIQNSRLVARRSQSTRYQSQRGRCVAQGNLMQLPGQLYGNARVVTVTGRIDHDNSEDFKLALQPHLENCKAGGEVVVLDFSGVNYISSAGFRVLLLAHRQAATEKSAFAVAARQPLVAEIFAISKFDKIVACHASVREAIAALAPAALATYAA